MTMDSETEDQKYYRTVLICDDEEDILDVTKFILEDNGYYVIAVNDSQRVIEKIQLENPDLVLIDLAMPGLTGDQIVAWLKHQEGFQDIPVVVFSADRDGQSVAFRSGANDFLAKPFDIDQLLRVIDKHIKN